MPLQPTPESPTTLATSLLSAPKPAFLIVYASKIDGRMWCGDCRAAEPLVSEKFADAEQVVKIVYAGEKLEWRKEDNVWKKQPFLVTHLPTVIKITEEGKWERLVEEDVFDQRKLDAFVGKVEKRKL